MGGGHIIIRAMKAIGSAFKAIGAWFKEWAGFGK